MISRPYGQFIHRHESCCLKILHSRHGILPIPPGTDDKLALADQHVGQPSPSSLLQAKRIPQAQPVGIGGVSIL